MKSPKVSVIIPVKDGEATIGECVRRLRASDYERLEIIAVDDHSRDGTAEAAKEAGATVARSEKHGVSAARNLGAKMAAGDYLIFTDADVMFEPGAVTNLLESFRSPDVDAAVGLFAKTPSYNNFASVYKNAWMRFTHKRMPDRVSLFFTSAAAIKKDVFERSGGFDENYTAPSVEDTDLGRRLADAGVNIQMRRGAEVVHCKKYTIAGVLATDFKRSAALCRLFLREKARGAKTGSGAGANKKFSAPVMYGLGAVCMTAALALFIISAASFAATGLFCVYSVALAAAMSVFAFAAAVPFFKYLAATHGSIFMFISLVFWVIDCPAVAFGAVFGAAGFAAGNRY